MVGNEDARQRLAQIINLLRQSRQHIGIPEDLLKRYYDAAIKLLSEVEAAMGPGKMPEEFITQHLRFSHDLIKGLEYLMALEEGHKTMLLAHYMKKCIDIFPQIASQAARRFNISDKTIMEVAEKILKPWTRESVHFANIGSFFVFYEAPGGGALSSFVPPIMYNRVMQLGGIHIFEKIALEAFEEIIKIHVVEDAYQLASSEMGMFRIRPGDARPQVVIRAAFILPFTNKFDNGTAEEKIAYSLLLHAVFRCYERTILQ